VAIETPARAATSVMVGSALFFFMDEMPSLANGDNLLLCEL
jgi:hypothetical protein